MPRPLLCAVDQSIEAREAAVVAGCLAARLDAPLVLAHVLADRPTFPAGSAVEVERHPDDRLDAAQLVLERITSDIATGRQPRVRLAFGDPSEKIMALGDDEDAQMLIVGSRGRGSLDAAISGGVSSHLATRSARPVLVVPTDAARRFRRSLSKPSPSVLCGVNGSGGAEHAARHAGDLAARLGLRLVLVHVYGRRPRALGIATPGALPHHSAIALESGCRSGREILDRAAGAVRSDVGVSLSLQTGDPAAVLARRAAHERAAVIVTGSRARGALTSALLGSVSARLAAGARRPIMVVSGDAEAQARLPEPAVAANHST
jgi:nucleotide-binding universal stress UspA family protein